MDQFVDDRLVGLFSAKAREERQKERVGEEMNVFSVMVFDLGEPEFDLFKLSVVPLRHFLQLSKSRSGGKDAAVSCAILLDSERLSTSGA